MYLGGVFQRGGRGRTIFWQLWTLKAFLDRFDHQLMRINKLNKTLLVWLKCVGADNICGMLHYCIIGHSKMSSRFTTEITIDQNLVLAASCDLVSFIITIMMIITLLFNNNNNNNNKYNNNKVYLYGAISVSSMKAQ